MIDSSRPTRRGLTLIELLLSLTITMVIGMAMTGVIGAVVSGVDVRRDSRAHTVRAYAAQSRLAAYIVPSRAFLHVEDDMIVLWFNDSRKSDSVHASEVRWVLFDPDTKALTAYFVRFPENWTTVEKWLADREYEPDSNWASVLQTYRSAGHIGSATLVDGISAMSVSTDDNWPLESRHIVIRLTFSSEGGEMTAQFSATLRRHAPPAQ